MTPEQRQWTIDRAVRDEALSVGGDLRLTVEDAARHIRRCLSDPDDAWRPFRSPSRILANVAERFDIIRPR